MDPALASFAARAAPKMSEAEFLARVAKARQEFDGLLDDEAIALLVLDEAGLNAGAFLDIADLGGRTEASLRVTVERVEPPREFAREGRPPGRVCNVIVSDSTGEARVVLWDKDVEKAEDGTLKPGAAVTLIGVRVKESRYGVELHVTPWTAVEVAGALDAAKRKLLMDVQGNGDALALTLRGIESDLRPKTPTMDAPGPLRGTFVSVSVTRSFRRADGAVGFACDAEFDAPDGRIKVICWDDAVKAVRSLVVGTPVEVTNLVAKQKGEGHEWHTSKETRFKKPVPGDPNEA